MVIVEVVDVQPMTPTKGGRDSGTIVGATQKPVLPSSALGALRALGVCV